MCDFGNKVNQVCDERQGTGGADMASQSELIKALCPPSRKHVQRLRSLAERMDKAETYLQDKYGDAKKNSLRASARLDAAAIRGVLAAIEGA